ncbi:ABC transporter permease subunit [Dermatophilaceae bacterium Soc4.6]
MPTELVRLDLRLRRRMLLGTAVGTAAYLFLVVAVYPTFKHDTAFDALITANPGAAAAFGISGSITSPEGWLSANMYANIGPLLALLLTIGYGAAAVAGQDGDGLLGLLATAPVTRPRIVAAKALTLLLAALVVPVVSFAVCLTGPHFGLHPAWGDLLGLSIALTLLAFDLGAVALLVGAVTGGRAAAMGAAGAVAACAYLISSLSPVVDVVHRIRWLSPFVWAVGDGQLSHGVSVGELGALTGVGLVLTGATVLTFRRLDIH